MYLKFGCMPERTARCPEAILLTGGYESTAADGLPFSHVCEAGTSVTPEPIDYPDWWMKGWTWNSGYLFASIQLQANPTLVKWLNSNIILCKIRSVFHKKEFYSITKKHNEFINVQNILHEYVLYKKQSILSERIHIFAFSSFDSLTDLELNSYIRVMYTRG